MTIRTSLRLELFVDESMPEKKSLDLRSLPMPGVWDLYALYHEVEADSSAPYLEWSHSPIFIIVEPKQTNSKGIP